jgi:hypothetical protein
MEKIGNALWDIGLGVFIAVCLVLLVHNDKQIDVGLRQEAYKCIAADYDVMIGEKSVNMTKIDNVEEFLDNYRVIDIDDGEKVVKLRKNS